MKIFKGLTPLNSTFLPINIIKTKSLTAHYFKASTFDH